MRIEPSARIESPPASGGLGGGVAAVLFELVGLLERLARGEAGATLDLRSLPINPQERADLQAALGEGEVTATVTAEGLSSIRETHTPGLWWIEHRDRHGDLIAELLEVTRVPEILASATDEIGAGARALRERITAAASASTRVEN